MKTQVGAASLEPDSTDLYLVLSPVTPRDVRERAFQRLALAYWSRGWDACHETWLGALATAGLNVPDQSQRPEAMN